MNSVRLSELIGKDIVNIQNGRRLGTVADSDLVIQAETGEIESIILPSKGGFINFLDKGNYAIPWNSIRKIGPEVIIVELDDSHFQGSYKRYTY